MCSAVRLCTTFENVNCIFHEAQYIVLHKHGQAVSVTLLLKVLHGSFSLWSKLILRLALKTQLPLK